MPDGHWLADAHLKGTRVIVISADYMPTANKADEIVMLGAHFDSWWKRARQRRPDLLTFDPAMLVNPTVDEVVENIDVGGPSMLRAAAKNFRDVGILTHPSQYQHVVDELKAALSGMLSPESKENILGLVEIRQVFRISRVGVIAGCYVLEGTIRRGARVRLLRDNVVIHDGELDSLKRFKDDVREVAQGFECGIGIENFNDIKVGDIIEAYRTEEVARTLKPTEAPDR